MRLELLGTTVRHTISLCCGLICLSPTLAAEWPQWRGPYSDGSVSGPSRESPLPDELAVVWKRQIGGGYSGPIVSGDRVWAHSRQGGEEVVSCFGLSTGETLWRKSYTVPFHQDDDARSHGRGPYATPVLSDGRLFTFSVTSVLIAWDAATGELLWRKDSAAEFDPSFPYFGAAASPRVWQDLVVVHLGGHQRDHPEAPSRGAMVALHATDGHEIWRWSGDGPAVGATPVVTEIQGEPQLVFKASKTLVGLDPHTGVELWRIPYVVSQDNTIVTPFFVGGHLITSDFDWGICAWEIQVRGEEWTVRQLWKHRDVSMFMSTPVLAGGYVVGFSHFRSGQLFVLDPESGEVRWQVSPRSGEHASLVSWGDEVMVFTDHGSLIIGKVARERFLRLKEYRLGDSVGWSHPAVVGSRIIYRDGRDLVVYRLDQR